MPASGRGDRFRRGPVVIPRSVVRICRGAAPGRSGRDPGAGRDTCPRPRGRGGGWRCGRDGRGAPRVRPGAGPVAGAGAHVPVRAGHWGRLPLRTGWLGAGAVVASRRVALPGSGRAGIPGRQWVRPGDITAPALCTTCGGRENSRDRGGRCGAEWSGAAGLVGVGRGVPAAGGCLVWGGVFSCLGAGRCRTGCSRGRG